VLPCRSQAGAAEAGRKRDLGDRQVGVVQEAPGEVDAPRTGELVRGRAQMRDEEAAQVAGRYAEPIAELDLVLAVQRAGEDELHGAAHEFGAAQSIVGAERYGRQRRQAR
jgi:hypothetical protein